MMAGGTVVFRKFRPGLGLLIAPVGQEFERGFGGDNLTPGPDVPGMIGIPGNFVGLTPMSGGIVCQKA